MNDTFRDFIPDGEDPVAITKDGYQDFVPTPEPRPQQFVEPAPEPEPIAQPEPVLPSSDPINAPEGAVNPKFVEPVENPIVIDAEPIVAPLEPVTEEVQQ